MVNVAQLIEEYWYGGINAIINDAVPGNSKRKRKCEYMEGNDDGEIFVCSTCCVSPCYWKKYGEGVILKSEASLKDDDII